MKTHRIPPRWVARLLRALLDHEVAESVIGDLEESYQLRVKTCNRFARMIYVLEGLGFLRMMRMRRHKPVKEHLNPFDMLNNYLLVAWRNLRKEMIYAVMSIAGLAIGLASAVVIYTYVDFELSYDKFNEDHEQVYRVTEEFNDDARMVHTAMSHSPVYQILSKNLSGLSGAVRIMPLSGFVSADKETKLRETNFCFADSLFFNLFTLPAVAGSTPDALHSPFAVVITEDAALRLYQTTDVVGKPLYFEDEVKVNTFHIAAVIRNFPANAHFKTDFIASFSTLDRIMPWYNNWHHPPMYVYMKFMERTDEVSANQKIQNAIEDHQPAYIKEEKRKYLAQPIASIHLNSNLDFEWQANSRLLYVQAFIALGVFIVLISCINFVNLATAQVIRRAREAGVRKVFGSGNAQLMLQFLSETFLHVMLALVLAVGIGEFALRTLLNRIIGQQLHITDHLTWSGVGLAVLFALVVALLAGLYPAFYFARFKPAAVLKRANPGGTGRDFLRKGLVTFQIIVSCLLICGTIVIYSQVNYFRNKELGFAKEEVVAIRLTDRFAQTNYRTLKENLLRESSVAGAGLSSALPGEGTYHGFDIRLKGSDTDISIKTLGVDEDFLSTYGIPIVDGRDFSKDILTDEMEAFIINRAAAKKLGWDTPVGQEISLTVYIDGAKKRAGKVIGVVEDFHFESLHRKVEPLLLYINKHPFYAEMLSVRMRPGTVAGTVNVLQKQWQVFHPDKPLDFAFISDHLDNAYQSEATVGRILLVLSAVAIAISVLGIFALSSYMSMRRAKEMSIRKVFGASNLGILLLQSKEYVVLTLIANVIVIPLALIGATQWLDSFAYHITLQPAMFLLTVIASIALTLLIISFHVIKVVMASPVAMMRAE